MDACHDSRRCCGMTCALRVHWQTRSITRTSWAHSPCNAAAGEVQDAGRQPNAGPGGHAAGARDGE
eukprot:7273907-Lingulodinium_polyedra.AAC.1